MKRSKKLYSKDYMPCGHMGRVNRVKSTFEFELQLLYLGTLSVQPETFIFVIASSIATLKQSLKAAAVVASVAFVLSALAKVSTRQQ